MRSLLTPSRVAVLVISLTLMSFLWTFGLPNQLASPSIPIISHDNIPAKEHSEPLIPEPVIDNIPVKTPPTPIATPPHAGNPDEVDEHAEGGAKGGPTTAVSPPAETEKPVSGEEGNGRPGDTQDTPKESAKQKDKPKQTAAAAPTTLKTEAVPSPTAQNVTAASAVPSPTPVGSSKHCKDVRGAPNVMIIVKTSKAEIYDKLPTHLLTLLECVPNFAIFSDHAGTIDGFTVHDALADISNSSTTIHDEFREYEKIKADATYKPSVEKTKALDKWKFLPMAYQAYKMRPYSRFYLIIEADTSLSWTNLLQWLDRLDYRIPYYSGAPMFVGNMKYAQRGSGILLSNGALRLYAKTYNERYASEWEKSVGKECCGDLVLANTMTESHVEFYSAWPLLQGETPSTLDWTKRHWCAPSVSWHHMTTQEIDLLWGFQRNWTHKYGWEVPYLIKNAWEDFTLPHLSDKKDEWDNISSDTHITAEAGRREKLAKEAQEKEMIAKEKEHGPAHPDTENSPPDHQNPHHEEAAPARPPRRVRRDDKAKGPDWSKIGETVKDAADSAEHCQAVCAKVEDCMQWKYSPKGDGECHLGKVVRLGRKVEKRDGDAGWTSGWMLERIQKTTKEWGECEKPNWRFNQ